jgi:hypothetical protein
VIYKRLWNIQDWIAAGHPTPVSLVYTYSLGDSERACLYPQRVGDLLAEHRLWDDEGYSQNSWQLLRRDVWVDEVSSLCAHRRVRWIGVEPHHYEGDE